MKTLYSLMLAAGCIPAFAATYTVPSRASSAAIQAIVNIAGAAPGNTVLFSPGTYSLSQAIDLPCANGTVYTGPNVGVVTQANVPVAVLTNQQSEHYALATLSNGTQFTPGQGCTIQYLTFSGTQGGIYVTHPSSGITIQDNYFTLNDPPVNTYAQPNIYLDGDQETTVDSSFGASYITIVWNVFYNNCAQIIAFGGTPGSYDTGGYCAATMVSAYNNHLVWSNNTVNLIEEGLKMLEMGSGPAPVSLNADVENNNLQGNERIMIESQIDTNGVADYSHNAFYNPANPNNNTFELSIPEWTVSASPTHIADDNVYIGGVPIPNETGPNAHYGIGLEIWGPGSVASNSLFQGGNDPQSCGAGYGCYGWVLSLGGSFSDASITGNYFSGSDVWAGSPSVFDSAITYEDGASPSNPGLVMDDNIVVQTSTTIPTVPPTISRVQTTNGTKVTLSDRDTRHRLSIFYTTDGSTPAIFAPGGAAGTTQLYSAPFIAPANATVKAIASWGQGANQGIVFPLFGYVPSSVVTSGPQGALSTPRSIARITLLPKTGSAPLVVGGTLQVIAKATYSDGTSAILPDADGNKVTAWNTSNHRIAKVSSQGHTTALAQGTVNVTALVAGSIVAEPLTVTVSTSPGTVVRAYDTPAVSAAAPQEMADAAGIAAEASPAPAATPATPGTPAATPAAQSPLAPVAAATQPDLAGPVPAAPAGPLPDNFIGPFWTMVGPAGGSASISNSHLFLGVPGGANHDPFSSTNQAVRVVQPIGNVDFDVAIKVDSPLVGTDGNTSQGIMVLAANGDFLTFAFTTDGARVGLMARTVTAGAATTVLDDSALSDYQTPAYLRLRRSGSSYVALYSVDGSTWKQAASFTDNMATASIGPFASNYNNTPANAVPVVMAVNWFEIQ